MENVITVASDRGPWEIDGVNTVAPTIRIFPFGCMRSATFCTRCGFHEVVESRFESEALAVAHEAVCPERVPIELPFDVCPTADAA
jgi:hypothetical protein